MPHFDARQAESDPARARPALPRRPPRPRPHFLFPTLAFTTILHSSSLVLPIVPIPFFGLALWLYTQYLAILTLLLCFFETLLAVCARARVPSSQISFRSLVAFLTTRFCKHLFESPPSTHVSCAGYNGAFELLTYAESRCRASYQPLHRRDSPVLTGTSVALRNHRVQPLLRRRPRAQVDKTAGSACHWATDTDCRVFVRGDSAGTRLHLTSPCFHDRNRNFSSRKTSQRQDSPRGFPLRL